MRKDVRRLNGTIRVNYRRIATYLPRAIIVQMVGRAISRLKRR
jgi:hypothetical protein